MESEPDFLIEDPVPGAPLLITFAFVNWERPADFYLTGRGRRLEQLTGRRFNRILLRDRRNLWYLRGVPDLGDSLETTIERLRQIIESMAPQEVWCVGESMGGYAALLYGILLGADRIVAFGPLSTFSADFAAAYGDLRWHRVMTSLDPAALAAATDLPELARQRGFAKRIHLIAGTSAGPDAPEDVNLDVMHAERFAGLPGVRHHYFPKAQHAVTRWLADNDRLDALMLHCLCDGPAPEEEGEPAPGYSSPADFEGPVLLGGAVGMPLLVCFADRETDDLLGGGLSRECAQVEEMRGLLINRLIVRGSFRGDLSAATNVAGRLKHLIASLGAKRVVCVGSGLGAYAALRLGPALGAHRILAFDPLSIRDRRLAALWHDRRHDCADDADLLPILAKYPGRVYVACSAKGVGTEEDVGSHAAVHAQRLATLPNVHVQPWPVAGNLASWMREKKLLSGFLSYCGFG